MEFAASLPFSNRPLASAASLQTYERQHSSLQLRALDLQQGQGQPSRERAALPRHWPLLK